MKITCNRSTLINAVNTVQKAVLTKSTLPILEGIFIQADRFLKLTGNNLELGIEQVADAKIEETGSIVTNSKIFGEIIRKLPDEKVTISTGENNIITISSGNSEFNIKGIESDEFPEIPKVEKNNALKVKQSILKNMIRQTSFAIGTNENKIILTGSLIEASDNLLTMVSVDGYRLALRREIIENKDNNFSFVVPGKSLSELFKIIEDNDEEINIYFTDKHAMFEFGQTKVVTRLLIGDFLEYNKIIPEESKLKVTLNVKNFTSTIDRASLIITADNKKYPIVLNITYDKIFVHCMTDMGKVQDSVDVRTFGDDLEIGFNHKYLLDALKACETEEAIFEFNDSLSPCIIKPVESNKFIYLVLPVRLKQE